jgi:hypothetical protein
MSVLFIARNPRFNFVHANTKPRFLTKMRHPKSGIQCSGVEVNPSLFITRPRRTNVRQTFPKGTCKDVMSLFGNARWTDYGYAPQTKICENRKTFRTVVLSTFSSNRRPNLVLTPLKKCSNRRSEMFSGFRKSSFGEHNLANILQKQSIKLESNLLSSNDDCYDVIACVC